ncbi:helix-turn-helix domain-containing protein [Dactylosporangium sp. CA-233914]|uniref:helix-turn-helix domain-containing protein n=1 Tax=Dactylosporangium sp. CA-233914 TaxID=3239934 RepID=UPI003D93D81D
MTEPSKWRDVKAKARAVDPTWDGAERVARRAAMRQEMLASVSGAQLADIRKQLGLTQAQLAEAAGLSQARISQIENGTATSLESLRAYVAGLGGTLTSSLASATFSSTSPEPARGTCRGQDL